MHAHSGGSGRGPECHYSLLVMWGGVWQVGGVTRAMPLGRAALPSRWRTQSWTGPCVDWYTAGCLALRAKNGPIQARSGGQPRPIR